MGKISLELIPDEIRNLYEVHEWKDILAVLQAFRLRKSWVTNPGGRKSKVSNFIDGFLYNRGWVEKEFETKVVVDELSMTSPTHKVDCFKNKIALEIEWNNKDPFYDRDLNNFRLLFDSSALRFEGHQRRRDHHAL